MTEQTANNALYESAAKHAAEQAHIRRVLAPAKPRKPTQKKSAWLRFFGK